MTAQKLMVVVGATGGQAGSIVDTFLADSSWRVRGLTRSASSSKAKALQARGVEVVEANLNDPASLLEAFQGANAIYGVTDFWTLFGDQSLQSRVKPGQTMIHVAYDMEIQQGKNIFDAASKIPTLERLVFSTLPNVTKLSGGKYTKAIHFDSKALAADYGQQTYPELWSKTSTIQVGFYLTNLLSLPMLQPAKNPKTGIYEFPTNNTHSLMPMIATEEDVGPLVQALVTTTPGKRLLAYRQEISMTDYAELWGQILGVETKVIKTTNESLPADMAEEIADTFDFAKEFGMFGQKVDKESKSYKELELPVQLGTVEEWIKKQDWSHIVKA